MSAWRILYTTTVQDGVPALSSGVVAIPDSMGSGSQPVIAWAAIAKDITSRGSVGPIAIATSFLVVPYSEYYHDVQLSDYVATPARRLAREMAARCTSEPGLLVSVLSSLAVSHDRPIFQLDPTTGPLASRLAENVPRGPFTQPLLIAQGGDDEVIAARIQDAYVASLCASGQPLEYRTYPGKNHMGVLGEESALPEDLAQWTKDRLDGLSPTDTCLR
jgi:acetyl esterase/lipase